MNALINSHRSVIFRVKINFLWLDNGLNKLLNVLKKILSYALSNVL